MKVLHSAFAYLPSPGVVNQMGWEQQAAKDLNLDWDVLLFCNDLSSANKECPFAIRYTPKGIFGKQFKFIYWVIFRIKYYQILRNALVKYDLLLLRYSPYDPFQLLFMWGASKPVWLVHHTLEYNEIRSKGGFRGLLLANFERFFGWLSLKNAKGIVAVTHEIANYESARVRGGKNFFVYPNGILLDSLPLEDGRGEVPELLFVAGNFSSWHGLDLIIEEFLHEKHDFLMHLVGGVPRSILDKVNGDSRFVCHGTVDANRIAQLMRTSWIGLSSFALHRIGMKEACTLKVREYLAAGLPVYSGHADVFPSHFKFYRFGKPNSTEIVAYAVKCRDDDKRDVAMAAQPYIDKRSLILKLNQQLKAILLKDG